MFAVIYRFRVPEENADDFLGSWKELTEMLIRYEGGLGSALHKSEHEPGEYIAYARWPDRNMWAKQPKLNLPPEAEIARTRMRDACEEISTLYELEILEDLLVR
ncbi:MAG: antibiotic biosynthesis monooxygenase [Ignavibacteria bacterium]|nr:antibiotic biosynthesis monooxygenase [Ignavibacteria bacterium]